jgi:hypothetical protein
LPVFFEKATELGIADKDETAKKFAKAVAGFLLQCETVSETWRQVDSPGYDHG